MSDTFSFTVPLEARNERLDRFLGGRIADVSRERVKKAVREGACLLDGRVCASPSARLAPGQTVTLSLTPECSTLLPEAGELSLVYSDAALAVLDKPAGLTVHPCPSCTHSTLVHRLLAYFPELARMEGLRPGIVHRLDKDTSGLLVVALNESSRLALARAFAQREVRKEYLALARGVPHPPQAEISAPVGRHPALKTKMAVVPENKGGKAAHSRYETLYVDPAGRYALLKVRIFTGRTHQIRVHLAHIGHPLWGDTLYGSAGAVLPGAAHGHPSAAATQRNPAARQMLHAHLLAFPHPASGERIILSSPPPPDFLRAALALSRRMQMLVVTGAPGSGKSTLLRELKEHGLPCFSADAAVHALYSAGGDGHFRVRQRFGEHCAPDGAPVDRAALRAVVCEDPRLLRELEDMIHPLVFHRLEEFRRQAENAGALRAAAEVPLYFESGEKRRDPADAGAAPLRIGVACAENVRRARLADRSDSDAKTARAHAALDVRQWPQERKLAACDIVIDNSFSPERLKEQTRSLLLRLDEMRGREEEAFVARLAALWT